MCSPDLIPSFSSFQLILHRVPQQPRLGRVEVTEVAFSCARPFGEPSSLAILGMLCWHMLHSSCLCQTSWDFFGSNWLWYMVVSALRKLGSKRYVSALRKSLFHRSIPPLLQYVSNRCNFVIIISPIDGHESYSLSCCLAPFPGKKNTSMKLTVMPYPNSWNDHPIDAIDSHPKSRW